LLDGLARLIDNGPAARIPLAQPATEHLFVHAHAASNANNSPPVLIGPSELGRVNAAYALNFPMQPLREDLGGHIVTRRASALLAVTTGAGGTGWHAGTLRHSRLE